MDILGVPFCFPGVPGVKALFQTPCCFQDSYGGYFDDLWKKDESGLVSYKARQRILENIGVSSLVEITQVHGNVILFNPEPTYRIDSLKIDDTLLQEADGISTTQRGIALLIKTADCQPIFFVDIKGYAIAALHVGWRGNKIDFPGEAVKAFCFQHQCEPKDVLVVRGPSLSRNYARFTNFVEEWGEPFRPWFYAERQTMDLWALTNAQLMDSGVPRENIYNLDLCTYASPELFFSYRRDPLCGRQGSLIWLES